MRILLCVALLLTAAGCGGQGEGEAAPSSLPSVTRSVTRTPVQPSGTRSAAGPTASPPTRSGRPQRTSQAPKPSRVEPTPKPSGVEPTRTTSAGAAPAPAEPSPTSASVVPTLVNSPSPTPSATQPDSAAATDDEGGVAPWVWWAVGLLAVTALVAAAVLLRRRRARVEWATGLDETLAEVTWLSTELIPTLLGESPAGRPGVWAIGRPRVLGLERTLAGLVGQAPDDVTARHCTALSSTVQALRRVLDQPEGAGVVGGEASATALRQAQAQLDEAVVVLQGRSGAGHST